MTVSRETKYKECMPEETVERIKVILEEMGIVLEENWGDTGIEGLFTLRVNAAGTGLGSNGKGATREYAQASAYAEFMERMQNDCLSLGDYDEDTWKYRGFYYTPDEKIKSAAELAESDNAFVEMLISASAKERGKIIESPENRADYMAMWQFPVFQGCSDKFVTVRYYSVKNKCYEYLPQAICMKLYRSNGMCAGNTPEEALVQGLSEVLERHVNLRIIKERTKLPTIPDRYLAKYERLYKIIRGIEKEGRYKVLVKDGSLGKGYPVVALIIIDRKRQSYGVRFGAHPEFEIALERTLSEAFQGKSVESFTGLSIFRFDNAGVQFTDNISNIAKIGLGQYPAELFSEAADYGFEPFADVTGKSNCEMLKDMLRLITSQGYDILIKDSSYLGFPAYHVISPGFSEIHEASLLKVREVCSGMITRKALRNLHNASDDELKEVASYLKYKQNSINENTFSTLVGVDFRNKYIGGKCEHYFLIGACLYKLGIYKEAAAVFELVAYELSGSEEKLYYRCIADYAAAIAENKPAKEIAAILGLFYPEDIAQKVCGQMEDPGRVMKSFYPEITCFNCSECGAANNCSYSATRSIKRALKDRQASARLKDLRELRI
ncbi:MAG TPA: YcaO-like family protein [Bacillota bacterium]|nr:YcaO-like family protein [Bacillota bacterium]HPL53795.1 YcaO-like family protein [Bacillota bacterium]